jgi:hypothetical protein
MKEALSLRATWLEASYLVEYQLNIDVSLNATLKEYTKLLEVAEIKWEEFRRKTGKSTTLFLIPMREMMIWSSFYSTFYDDFLYGVPSQKKQINYFQPRAP